MKDITSTSFGLIIAFLLPGLTGMFGLSFSFGDLKSLFSTFETAESNVGLFLIVILLAVCLGLQITAIRWIVFERILCFPWKLKPEEFANLGAADKLIAFRAAVDEHYRYHQFWGGMSLTLPLYYQYVGSSLSKIGFSDIKIVTLFIIVELITVSAAMVAYKRYIDRSRAILKGI